MNVLKCQVAKFLGVFVFKVSLTTMLMKVVSTQTSWAYCACRETSY